jgi:hypothetical protein
MGCASYSQINFRTEAENEAIRRENLRKERKAKIEYIFELKKGKKL